MKKQTKLGLVLAAAAVLSVSVASLVSARGWVQNGADWYYVDNDNEYITDTIQASGNAKFYLGEDGSMQRDFFLEDYDGQTYYFGSNGAMVTNTWVAIESSRVENNADYVPDNYWYYFQSSGKAMKGSNGSLKKTTIDGKKYVFNENGQMSTGWIDSDGNTIDPDEETNPFKDALYYAGGDNDGVLRAGWVSYYDGYDDDDGRLGDKTVLYFYFNTNNNKKYGYGAAETKKINGRSYAFSNEGVMLSGWDVVEQVGGSTSISALNGKMVYFSGEDDGHQVKKGWVYAVPAQSIDSSAYTDDEEKYMYFNAAGVITQDKEQKVNGKYYVFDRNGIMKTGLVIWVPNSTAAGKTSTYNYKYVGKVDFDWAEGKDIVKKGYLRLGDTDDKYIVVAPDGQVRNSVVKTPSRYAGLNASHSAVDFNDYIKLRLYGSDGARKTGTNTIEFSDDAYTFYSNSGGDRGSGVVSKKYYALGLLLKASSDIRYGIYNKNIASTSALNGGAFAAQGDKKPGSNITYYQDNIMKQQYEVLTTAGTRQKGAKAAKKDADGNYWLIEATDHYLKGIWSVNVRFNEQKNWKSRNYSVNSDAGKALTAAESITWGKSGQSGYIKSVATSSLVSAGIIIDAAWDMEIVNTESNTVGRANNFSLYENSDGSEFYLATGDTRSLRGDWYSSDFGDGIKWIPFGWVDNSGNTCAHYDKVTAITDDQVLRKVTAYEIIPNDDYFTNCYWTNS
jgi:glucan-binding YG repeat protein